MQTPPLHSMMVEFANEGVPVLAIARATKTPSDEVFELLRAAVNDGNLFSMPNSDWPPGRMRTPKAPSETAVLSLDDQQLLLLCAGRFCFTPLQTRVFIALLRRSELTKDQLHNVIEGARDPNEDPSDKKIVDVVICHIRKKLKKDCVEIDTMWGMGYKIRPSERTRLLDMLHKHLQDKTAGAI